MRYFLEFAYNGTRFSGYQEQPNAYTIQAAVEKAIATLLRTKTKIAGCGRTDTGVHAQQYFAHFDSEMHLDENFVYKMNAIIEKDIVFYAIHLVDSEAHARFDATSRSYKYYLDLQYNPFRQETAYFCNYANKLDLHKMQVMAELLLKFEDFNTFCKTNSSAKTTLCDLRKSTWVYDESEKQLVYHVTANRFLRGMIRLIVGMSLQVGKGKVSLATVESALQQKVPLQEALSAPAKGLFLMDIEYSYI
jgi:tRNA pseudouridine38-40 synthase